MRANGFYPDRFEFDHRAGPFGAFRVRGRIEPDTPFQDPDIVGAHFFFEGRRRAAIVRQVLIAVPGTGDAAVDDAALAQRPTLMAAHIRYGGDLVAIAEDGDALVMRLTLVKEEGVHGAQ